MRPPDLTRRRRRIEHMDDPALDPAEHERALAGLARLHRATFDGPRLWRLAAPLLAEPDGAEPLRVLDVACGGGELLAELGRRAARAGRAVELWGCDRSDTALAHAERAAAAAGVSARFLQVDAVRALPPATPEGAPFHVMLCSLFLHHLSETDASDLLADMRAHSLRGLVVQDLLRSRSGWRWAWVGSRLLTRSRVVRHDALRSVEAAFSYSEMGFLIGRAGLHRNNTEVSVRWPSRLLLRWTRP